MRRSRGRFGRHFGCRSAQPKSHCTWPPDPRRISTTFAAATSRSRRTIGEIGPLAECREVSWRVRIEKLSGATNVAQQRSWYSDHAPWWLLSERTSLLRIVGDTDSNPVELVFDGARRVHALPGVTEPPGSTSSEMLRHSRSTSMAGR